MDTTACPECDTVAEVHDRVAGFRRFWAPHLDALATELARGRRGPKQAHPDERTTP